MSEETTPLSVDGRILRAVRENSGWSRTALAKEVEVHPSHLLRVESGERELSKAVAQRIAGVLGIPLRVFYREVSDVA